MGIPLSQLALERPIIIRNRTAGQCGACRTRVRERILVEFRAPHGPVQWVNTPCGCVPELKQSLKPEALVALLLMA